ncbi:MAG: hypothetical protein LBN34_01190 [Clostridiales Family XIII bacterium]|jgi:hypothetical protein|nr:hypothetical protein [Clostridiales Family XIII bacterium]
MRKRVLTVVLCILLAMSFASCGGGSKADKEIDSTPSSSNDDVYADKDKEIPYFDEKTRMLTAGMPDNWGTIEIYVPEECSEIDADSSFGGMIGGILSMTSKLDKSPSYAMYVVVYMYDNVEDGLDSSSTNGHYVKYGNNEYYTDEGASDDGAYYYIKVGEYTFEFTAGASPEYKSDLEKVLSTVKFNIKS